MNNAWQRSEMRPCVRQTFTSNNGFVQSIHTDGNSDSISIPTNDAFTVDDHSHASSVVDEESAMTSRLKARRASLKSHSTIQDEKHGYTSIDEAELQLYQYTKNEREDLRLPLYQDSEPSEADSDILDFEEEDSCERQFTSTLRSSVFRKWALIGLLATLTLYVVYKNLFAPWHLERTMLKEGIRYGPSGNLTAHMAPAFKHLTLLKDLDTRYVPRVGRDHEERQGRKSHRGRLVVVGDVHGMRKSLEKLLKKINFDVEKGDHLVLAGDMIAKGPDSQGVVQLAMDLGATGIRGNHEDRVLLAGLSMSNNIQLTPELQQDDGPIKQEHTRSKEFESRDLAMSFTRAQTKWLQACPVILRVGQLGSLGSLVVVHGGLIPWLALERQDPWFVMNMRSIDADTWIPSDGRLGIDWYKLWNSYQKSVARRNRSTVIYGHDSKRGLQNWEYSKGLDTNCQRGGKLTAFVIEGGKDDVKTKLVSIECPDTS